MKLRNILLELLTEAGGRRIISNDFFVEFNEYFQKDPEAKELLDRLKDPKNISKKEEISEELRKLIAKKFLNAVFVKLFGEAPKGTIDYKSRPSSDTVIATSSDGKIKAYISSRRKEASKGPRPFRILPDYTVVEYTPEDETLYLWIPNESSYKSKQYYSTIKKGVDKDTPIYAEPNREDDDLSYFTSDSDKKRPSKYRKYTVAGEKEIQASNIDRRAASNKSMLRTPGVSSAKKIKAFIDDYNNEKIDDPVWDKILNPYLQAKRANPDDTEEHIDRVRDLLSDIVDWALDKDFISYNEADPSKEDIQIEGDKKANEIKIVAKQGIVILTTYLDTRTHKINRNKTKLMIAGVTLMG